MPRAEDEVDPAGAREEISLRMSRDISMRQLARQLGRDPATMSREVRLGRRKSGYRAVRAAELARRRRQRPKVWNDT